MWLQPSPTEDASMLCHRALRLWWWQTLGEVGPDGSDSCGGGGGGLAGGGGMEKKWGDVVEATTSPTSGKRTGWPTLPWSGASEWNEQWDGIENSYPIPDPNSRNNHNSVLVQTQAVASPSYYSGLRPCFSTSSERRFAFLLCEVRSRGRRPRGRNVATTPKSSPSVQVIKLSNSQRSILCPNHHSIPSCSSMCTNLVSLETR